MFTPTRLSTLPAAHEQSTAQALVPEQLQPYVRAVSGATPILCGDCIAYEQDDTIVLVGYPLDSTENMKGIEKRVGARQNSCTATSGPLIWLDKAVEVALKRPNLQTLTVLAPVRPVAAPSGETSLDSSIRTPSDWYWSVPIPLPAPGQKLRNTLTRARRDCRVTPDLWTAEHTALVEAFIHSRPLEPGTRHMFRHIEAYLSAVPDAVLFSSRAVADDSLNAFCVGDFSSQATAFYMFAFRRLPVAPSGAQPGVADALLAALIDEATRRGHIRINLGLGINPGIAFFKKKWHAVPFLPYVQTSWSPFRKSWWNKWTNR